MRGPIQQTIFLLVWIDNGTEPFVHEANWANKTFYMFAMQHCKLCIRWLNWLTTAKLIFIILCDSAFTFPLCYFCVIVTQKKHNWNVH